MAKNPAQYGLDSIVKEKPVPYDTVKIDYPIDLRLAAECVDATAEDLSDLTPSLLRMTTPKDAGKGQPFELHLPAGTAAKFASAVAVIPADKRVWWRYHKVQPGETLASIAHTYHTTPKAIAEANDLEPSDLDPNDAGSRSKASSRVEAVAPETRLIIPIAPGKQTDTSTYARVTTHYKIRKGDTVASVAENFGISPKMLRSWNRLKGDSLAGHKVLALHLPVTHSAAAETESASKRSNTKHHAGLQSAASAKPASAARSAAGVIHHRVKAGETLYSIATSYNTTVTALKHDNRDVATLRPGMILVVHNLR